MTSVSVPAEVMDIVSEQDLNKISAAVRSELNLHPKDSSCFCPGIVAVQTLMNLGYEVKEAPIVKSPVATKEEKRQVITDYVHNFVIKAAVAEVMRKLDVMSDVELEAVYQEALAAAAV